MNKKNEILLFATMQMDLGEGNGNPLQCSCLENPRDGGAWRAAVYGVAVAHDWSDLAAAAAADGPRESYALLNIKQTQTQKDRYCMLSLTCEVCKTNIY